MKKEIRQRTVDYEVFISDDGTEFDNEHDALHHDKILQGEIKECPDCHGKGKIGKEEQEEDYHSGAPYWTTNYYTCDTCKGKGYLEKKIKVIWE